MREQQTFLSVLWLIASWSFVSRIRILSVSPLDAEWKVFLECHATAVIGCADLLEAIVCLAPVVFTLTNAVLVQRHDVAARIRSIARSAGVPVWKLIMGVGMFVIVYRVMTFMPRYSYLVGHQPGALIARGTRLEDGLRDEANVRIPRTVQGRALPLESRLRYMELKLGGLMNWGVDPFFGDHISERATCALQSELQEYGCADTTTASIQDRCPGFFDHNICLDHLPHGVLYKNQPVDGNGVHMNRVSTPAALRKQAPCLVYDFGIRENPDFGLTMANAFDCEVHGFDPSPITTAWAKRDDAPINGLERYTLHPFGAGGLDGNVVLNEYDWGQVSIIRYPGVKTDCTKARAAKRLRGVEEPCELIHMPTEHRKAFTLPVKTLKTIISELHHTNRIIDVLKVDVEGSEWAFLHEAIDTGALEHVRQLTLEWHHYDGGGDPRYGHGSDGNINAIATVLAAIGFDIMSVRVPGGWAGITFEMIDAGMKPYYNLATFIRND